MKLNYSKKSRTLSIILAFMLIVSIILFATSCGNDNNNTSNNNQNAVGEEGNYFDDSEVQGRESERILADVPVVDYNGHQFNVLTFGVQGSYEWENFDISVEEENGEPINDAVYTRNRIIEEKYNININQIHMYDGNFGTSLRNAIGAGTNDYDLISPRLVDSAGYIQDGFFLNLFTVPNIDLGKPWWDSQGVAEMSIDNKIFLVLSDILLSDDNATSITIFNKKLAQDYGLEDPYALVRDGKWTIDKLYDMAKATAVDLNGDGQMTSDADQFGYLTWNDAMVTYLHSGGERLISKDENDLPVLTFNNERTYEIVNKVMDLLCDENVTGNVQKPTFSDTTFEDIFSANRATFAWVRLYMVPRLRAMDADFGILPVPKIYENTPDYISTVNVHTACSLAIPVTSDGDDLDRATIIMEALAAEAHYLLPPAYYEVSLRTKHARDEESSEMLDIILSNRAIDVGDVYNFADFGINFYRLAQSNDRNLASFYDRYETRVNTAIDRLIQRFEGLD